MAVLLISNLGPLKALDELKLFPPGEWLEKVVLESLFGRDAVTGVQGKELAQQVEGIGVVDHRERSRDGLDGILSEGREILELGKIEQMR